ncbi:hypothetical protein ACHAXT_001900 [Thalassiosira profunda]
MGLPLLARARAFSANAQRREVAPKGQAAAPTDGVWLPPSQNKSQRKGRVFTAEQPEDLLDFIIEDDRLCVVKVYASWCVTCKKFDARYRKIANQYGADGSVRFAEMRYDNNPDNEELCRDVLQIETFPYILMYKGDAGKVEGFHCTPAKYHLLVEAVKKHLGGKEEGEASRGQDEQHDIPTHGIYDGKLWDHTAKNDVYNKWDPLQSRSPLNFNPFELFRGNHCDASGYYPGEPRYREPISGNVSPAMMRAEETDVTERKANPKPGSDKGCPGCKN